MYTPNLHRFNMRWGFMIEKKLLHRFRSLWCHQRPVKLTTALGFRPRAVVSFPGRWWQHNGLNLGINSYNVMRHVTLSVVVGSTFQMPRVLMGLLRPIMYSGAFISGCPIVELTVGTCLSQGVPEWWPRRSHSPFTLHPINHTRFYAIRSCLEHISTAFIHETCPGCEE